MFRVYAETSKLDTYDYWPAIVLTTNRLRDMKCGTPSVLDPKADLLFGVDEINVLAWAGTSLHPVNQDPNLGIRTISA